MALDKQVIPLPFSQGVDTKTDPKQVVIGKLLTLENGVFTSRLRIKKRFGLKALGLGNTVYGGLTSGRGMTAFRDELVIFGQANLTESLFSYVEADDAFANRGAMYSVNVTQSQVVRSTANQTQQDSALHPTGLQAFVWKDSGGGCRYSIVDRATKQTVIANQLVASTATLPKVFPLGNYLVITYVDSGNHNLYAFPISTSNPTTIPVRELIASTVNVATPQYDGTILSMRLFIAFYDNTNHVSVVYLNTARTVIGPVTGSTNTATNCITIFPDTLTIPQASVVVAFASNTQVRTFSLNYDLSANISDTLIDTVGSTFNISGVALPLTYKYYYTIPGGSSSTGQIREVTYTRATTTFAAEVQFLTGFAVAGKTFVEDNKAQVVISFTTPLQPIYFIVDETGVVVAKILSGEGGGVGSTSVLPETNSTPEGGHQIAFLQKDLLTTVVPQANAALVTAFNPVYTQTGVTSVEVLYFDSQTTFLHAEQSQNLHMSGGYLTLYDGVAPVEHGFHIYPEGLIATNSVGGGSLLAGTYQWVWVYEWTDGQGNIHRSAPSIPVSGVALAGDHFTIQGPNLRLTAKTNVSIVQYRTEANGATFYRESSITSPVISVATSSALVSQTSTVADSAIVNGQQLYTTGNVLENIAPPAIGSLTTFKSRVVGLPTVTPNQLWYSKQAIPGSPVEFSDILTLNVDPRGGDTTAVSNLDDKLIVFKSASIFYVSGDGPDSTGAQNDFSNAQLVTTDCGCITPRSVVTTPLGLMFQSQKGIYLLDRGLNVSYLGADVEAFNSNQVVSAVLITKTNQVRFGLDSSSTLVYDYLAQQWAVFTNHSQVDATSFQNEYSFLRSDAGVRQEDPTGFTDVGEPIKLRATTAWLNFAGLQGYQRAYRALILGEYVSPHILRVRTAYDYNPSYVQDDQINAATLGASVWGADSVWGGSALWGGDGAAYEYTIFFERQKCTAIQLTIEDVQSSVNAGEGLSLSCLTMMIGAKRGTNRQPATRKFG